MKEFFYRDVNNRGKITQIVYTMSDIHGVEHEKYVNVYLPFGYSQSDKARKYNVLYLMHGGGGNADAWLDCCKVKNMLDYAFDSGEADPFIVAFPSFYNVPPVRSADHKHGHEGDCVLEFQKEMTTYMIPAVEGQVNSFAESTDLNGLKASRKHRAFGGFSMGSVTSWYALMYNLDSISVFLPFSGDCWAIQEKGGGDFPEETAKLLYEAVKSSGYSTEDYRIFAATGTKDIAYPNLKPQLDAMKKYHDVFTFSEDFSQGNFHYFFTPEYVHSYEAVLQYLYQYLKYIF